ncbi:MAG: hypothetical protein ACW98D_21425 [Promethearchaeota archaeon]|jgi:hypothetical protein
MLGEKQRIDWGITPPPLNINRLEFVKTDKEKAQLATLKGQYKKEMREKFNAMGITWNSGKYTQKAVLW